MAKPYTYTIEALTEALLSSNHLNEVTTKLKFKTSGFDSIRKRINSLEEPLKTQLNTLVQKLRDNPKPHSQETKRNLSEKRKKFLKENPLEHNWSKYHKQETYPENKFKETLLKLGVSATQYYVPPENDRLFELDFANPDLKIAWEINGNQHYESDYQTLKEYYQQRHDYFVNKGWQIVEINFNECYVKDGYKNIILESLKDKNYVYSESPEVLDYRSKKDKNKLKEFYKYIKKIDNILKIKGEEYIEILSFSDHARYFFYQEKGGNWLKSIMYKGKEHLNRRKVKRPSKEELIILIQQKPMTQIGKDFGVSDRTIDKWIIIYGIQKYKPAVGWWLKDKISK